MYCDPGLARSGMVCSGLPDQQTRCKDLVTELRIQIDEPVANSDQAASHREVTAPDEPVSARPLVAALVEPLGDTGNHRRDSGATNATWSSRSRGYHPL